MDRLDHLDDIRMSNSPRRSPLVTHEVGSPVRSVHPDMMLEHIDGQADFGHRTTDFLDMNSDSDGEVDVTERHGLSNAIEPPLDRNFSRKRRSGNYLGGTTDQFRSHCTEKRASSPNSLMDYERDPHDTLDHPNYPYSHGYDSREGSFVGSVEELTPSRPARKSNLHIIAGQLHQRIPSSPLYAQEEESPILPKQNNAVHILQAHHLTMQALTGSERALNTITTSSSPLQVPGDRASRYPPGVDRSSRIRSASAPIKKVSMALPPINTSATQNWPTEKAVKTPYPFTHIHRKEFGRQFSTSEPALRSPRISDSILILSIRRSNKNSTLRLNTLTIFANSDFTTVVTSNNKEKHFAGLDFDDAELFRQLRSHYAGLLGPYRYLSARSLSGIAISGTATKAADAGYGWLLSPRSPRVLAFKGLTDTFSEEKMLSFFRNPKLAGKARYAWVSWAHRLAAALPSTTSTSPPISATRSSPLYPSNTPVNNRFSMIHRLDQHEGLEFIVSWSPKRILAVLAMIILLSLTATLLWVFLGKGSHVPGVDAGFRGAGDRVVSGVLIGMATLFVGLTGMGGWIGVSWLVL